MPSIAQAPLSVPRINLRDFSARREEIKEQLMSAASEIGFFTLVGHEISLEEVNKAFGLAERFFDLPTEVKQKYPWSPRNQGYESNQQIRPSTGYPDPKESYQVGFQRTEEQEALWPTEEDCPGFRRETEEFMRKVQGLSVKVMELFAEGLGLPANTFTEGTVAPEGTDKADSMSTLRLLKYHDCEGKDFGEGYMRAGAHADFDVMTFLFQRKGQSGLELCPGRKISTEFGYGDTWVPVDVEEGAIVINVGDQLMRWSDDRLKSTFHRVRCPRPGEYQGARYSIGFFNQARRDTVIQGPAKAYPKITGGEFIAQAMKRNFEAAQAKAKAKAYEISQETIEANKGFEVSGTGLAPVKAAA
ncbi:hypothetical protein NBRC10512_002084 [Rhodotorula toruloides]|uniref:RHTO0S11e03400g1_1 n=2 Tax=Rhodotorula toruloides TaxID=5286 RepID=A0A061B8J8_RHOTO|nr:long-chain fatty alcohol oxidase, FAO1 [Rhodotorula toruloides NP11]EMS21654.1 long-chain fatty alcohol oxidase, FAO1 [Rhodotorula toruloides NP11]CDR45693.1 RHTO0S11e03400g1_1 [Rhodotorula toruloides]